MIIYTDGACSGNGSTNSSGGYGVLIVDNSKNFGYNNFTSVEKVISCYSKHYNNNVTNNIMELKAILYSFLNYGININNRTSTEIPIVYSDSAYAVNTLTNWMFGWAERGWLKSDNKPPENLELIKAYYDWWQKGYRIDLRKIKGHSNNWGNNLADKLATGKITPEEVMKLYG